MSETSFTLIERPENPVLRFGKQLGRDEINAAVLGTLFTAAAYWLIERLSGGDASVGLMALVLPFVAPVCEKPGLVAHYLYRGVVAWKQQGGRLWPHVKTALTDGEAWRTVRADVFVHDPAFSALMAAGVWLLTPSSWLGAAFLASLSFVGAVILAAAMEVGYVEVAYKRLLRRLARLGFRHEFYHETRYLIVAEDARHSPAAVVERLADRFALTERTTLHYEDRYWTAHKLPDSNGRTANLRHRTVRSGSASGPVLRQTLQVVYTRPGEIGRDDASMFRCFVVQKEKFAQAVGEGGPDAATLARLGATGTPSVVSFSRMVARDRHGLFVSADVLEAGDSRLPFWIEAKVRTDLALLKRCNEYVAMHFPVRGTTKGKVNVVAELEEFRAQSRAA